MSGWNRKLLSWLLAGALLLGGCAKSKPESAASVLRISQRNEPGDLDPATANLPDELFIIRALSEGLVSPNPDGGIPVAAAAESWTVSDDGLTYTFHLRPDVTWSNGEPVTAADFVASYQRVLTPAMAAPKASLLFAVRGAEDFYHGRLPDFSSVGFEALGDYTLQIELARPTPQFLAYAATGPWIPVNPRTVAKFGRQWTHPENYVGNGPFTLSAWKPNQHIIVRRRADYWDAEQVKLNELRFLAFDSEDAEERAFRAGQLDVTMAVPKSKISGYADQSPTSLRQIPLHETRYLTFNTSRMPLGDIRVRRALALAIDREAIVQHVLRGGQQAARHFVPNGLGGFESTYALEENVARAQYLLAEAGYPAGAGFPVLELTGWSQTPVLEAVQSMWQEQLGIRVRIGVRDAKVHVAALEAGDYDIGFITAIPDVADPANLLANFRTGASSNYAQWSNPDFDRLLDLAAQQADLSRQLEVLAEAEELLGEKCPVAPLYFNTKNILVSPAVQGWQEDALWNRFYKGVSISDSP